MTLGSLTTHVSNITQEKNARIYVNQRHDFRIGDVVGLFLPMYTNLTKYNFRTVEVLEAGDKYIKVGLDLLSEPRFNNRQAYLPLKRRAAVFLIQRAKDKNND